MNQNCKICDTIEEDEQPQPSLHLYTIDYKCGSFGVYMNNGEEVEFTSCANLHKLYSNSDKEIPDGIKDIKA